MTLARQTSTESPAAVVAAWQRAYTKRLLITDFVVIVVSVYGSQFIRFGTSGEGLLIRGPESASIVLSYSLVSAILVLGWIAALARPAVRRVATVLLSPVIAMGAMPLSIYTIHLVVIALAIREENGVPTDNSWELVIGLVVGSMAFAWLWRRYLGRGPLERLLRHASGRDRADAAAAPTSG